MQNSDTRPKRAASLGIAALVAAEQGNPNTPYESDSEWEQKSEVYVSDDDSMDVDEDENTENTPKSKSKPCVLDVKNGLQNFIEILSSATVSTEDFKKSIAKFSSMLNKSIVGEAEDEYLTSNVDSKTVNELKVLLEQMVATIKLIADEAKINKILSCLAETDFDIQGSKRIYDLKNIVLLEKGGDLFWNGPLRGIQNKSSYFRSLGRYADLKDLPQFFSKTEVIKKKKSKKEKEFPILDLNPSNLVAMLWGALIEKRFDFIQSFMENSDQIWEPTKSKYIKNNSILGLMSWIHSEESTPCPEELRFRDAPTCLSVGKQYLLAILYIDYLNKANRQEKIDEIFNHLESNQNDLKKLLFVAAANYQTLTEAQLNEFFISRLNFLDSSMVEIPSELYFKLYDNLDIQSNTFPKVSPDFIWEEQLPLVIAKTQTNSYDLFIWALLARNVNIFERLDPRKIFECLSSPEFRENNRQKMPLEEQSPESFVAYSILNQPILYLYFLNANESIIEHIYDENLISRTHLLLDAKVSFPTSNANFLELSSNLARRLPALNRIGATEVSLRLAFLTRDLTQKEFEQSLNYTTILRSAIELPEIMELTKLPLSTILSKAYQVFVDKSYEQIWEKLFLRRTSVTERIKAVTSVFHEGPDLNYIALIPDLVIAECLSSPEKVMDVLSKYQFLKRHSTLLETWEWASSNVSDDILYPILKHFELDLFLLAMKKRIFTFELLKEYFEINILSRNFTFADFVKYFKDPIFFRIMSQGAGKVRLDLRANSAEIQINLVTKNELEAWNNLLSSSDEVTVPDCLKNDVTAVTSRISQLMPADQAVVFLYMMEMRLHQLVRIFAPRIAAVCAYDERFKSALFSLELPKVFDEKLQNLQLIEAFFRKDSAALESLCHSEQGIAGVFVYYFESLRHPEQGIQAGVFVYYLVKAYSEKVLNKNNIHFIYENILLKKYSITPDHNLPKRLKTIFPFLNLIEKAKNQPKQAEQVAPQQNPAPVANAAPNAPANADEMPAIADLLVNNKIIDAWLTTTKSLFIDAPSSGEFPKDLLRAESFLTHGSTSLKNLFIAFQKCYVGRLNLCGQLRDDFYNTPSNFLRLTYNLKTLNISFEGFYRQFKILDSASRAALIIAIQKFLPVTCFDDKILRARLGLVNPKVFRTTTFESILLSYFARKPIIGDNLIPATLLTPHVKELKEFLQKGNAEIINYMMQNCAKIDWLEPKFSDATNALVQEISKQLYLKAMLEDLRPSSNLPRLLHTLSKSSVNGKKSIYSCNIFPGDVWSQIFAYIEDLPTKFALSHESAVQIAEVYSQVISEKAEKQQQTLDLMQL